MLDETTREKVHVAAIHEQTQSSAADRGVSS